MVRIVVALVGAYGVYLLYTASVFGWSGLGVSPTTSTRRRRRHRLEDWLAQAGIERVRWSEFLAVVGVAAVVGAGLGYATFGGALPSLVAALGAASVPFTAARQRRERRLDRARDAWPRMIEEIRLQAVNLGRSIPQALFAVGARGPEELRPAFAAAQREWFISTDFDRTLSVLKARLADLPPTRSARPC